MKATTVTGLLAFCLLLAGCSSPPPAPQTLRIGLSPGAQPVSAAISVCIPPSENLAVSIKTGYPNVVDLNDYDVYIQLGEPDKLPDFVAPLARDNIVVVLHPSNNVELGLEQTADLFSGGVQDWAELGGASGSAQLWVGPAGDEARQSFEERVLRGNPVAGWAHLAANPKDLLAVVAEDPAAAGILPMAWVDKSVAAVDLGLQLPVLALALEEPTGPARELLACLQGQVGQEAIAERYTPYSP
ncbi:MAG: substrate-binding domain-containing protein [Anaerolineales bacterium]